MFLFFQFHRLSFIFPRIPFLAYFFLHFLVYIYIYTWLIIYCFDVPCSPFHRFICYRKFSLPSPVSFFHPFRYIIYIYINFALNLSTLTALQRWLLLLNWLWCLYSAVAKKGFHPSKKRVATETYFGSRIVLVKRTRSQSSYRV